MSEKPLRRRIPVNRRIKPPHPSLSTHKLHRKVIICRSPNDHSKLIKRCNSESTLLTEGISIAGAGIGDDHRNMTSPSDSYFMVRNRMISTDVFSSSPELLPNSLSVSQAYNKDAKVVVKVMVEGSVGPIRALVKLGASVDETIKLVMNKYNEQGRSPRLDQETITSFQLHHSCFSLQCLDKLGVIGEIGSRSFYMRKSVNNDTFIDSETVVTRKNDSPSPNSYIFLPSFIYQEFKKMLKRSCEIWRFLGCFGG